MGIEAYVTVPRAVSQSELEAITSELRSAGLEFDEPAAAERRITGVEEFVFVVAISTSLHGFFKRLGEEAGSDAYKALKGLVARLRAKAGAPEDGIVIVQDQRSQIRVDLTPELSDAAYRALLELDFEDLSEGTLTWDDPAGIWTQDG